MDYVSFRPVDVQSHRSKQGPTATKTDEEVDPSRDDDTEGGLVLGLDWQQMKNIQH